MHRAVSARPRHHGAGVGRETIGAPDKIAFSSCTVPSIVQAFHREARPKLVLCGIESHVCVLHTALDLLALAFRVYVVADAIGSRYRIDHDFALRRLERAGAILTTSEMCVFEWMGGAGHPQFKAVSRLIQERMKDVMILSFRPTTSRPLTAMNLPGPLNPPPRLLLGPGPSDAHPRVLRAMATPLLGHLDPQFLEIMNSVQEMLRTVYQTKNQVTFPVSATGMAGMETCFVNLVEPGDRVVICVAGFFGQRMVEMANRAGRRSTVIERPWGEVFDLQQIRETVRKVRPKLLAIVQAETSTGAWQPLEGLGELCHESDTLLLVDAVTALGCIPLALDAWQVDAVYSCSQKGLSCPPALSPVSFSPRAVEVFSKRKTKVQSWYFDVNLVEHYWDSDRFYHHTGPITMIYALYEGLRLVLEEGLEARWARHHRNHEALKAGLTALGLTYLANGKHQLPQLNVVRIPAGAEDLAVRKRLLGEFGIEIGGGLGDFKGKAWRIGLMGHNSRPDVVLLFLGALAQCLANQGIQIQPGAGVAAANRVYLGGA